MIKVQKRKFEKKEGKGGGGERLILFDLKNRTEESRVIS